MKFRTKLVFILILVGFFPLIIGGFFLFHLFNSYATEIIYENLGKVNKIAFVEVDRFVDGSIEKANILSENSVFLSDSASIEEIEDELKKAYNYYQLFFENITIIDRDREIDLFVGEEFSEDINIEEFLVQAEEKKDIVISDEYFNAENENQGILILIPLIREESPSSFIIAKVGIERLVENFNNFGLKKEEIFLINDRGEIISYPKERYIFARIDDSSLLKERMEGEKGVFDFELNDRQLAGSFIAYNNDRFDLRWYVVTAQSREDLLVFFRKALFDFLALSLIILLPIILTSFYLSRKITRPLKDLSFVARRIAMGDFKNRATISSKDEFGDLAESFNKMVKDLERAQKSMQEEKEVLEIKVMARTKELRRLNENLEEQIEERTRETQKKIRELEKLTKLMVGRESKMIELKEEIKRLKGKIEEDKD